LSQKHPPHHPTSSTQEQNPASLRYLGMERKWWVLLAIGISTFMSALDGSVVNTVLPVISAFFATDVSNIEWVVTIYLLVLSGLLLSFGRLGDLRGHKTVFISGFGIFIFSSALCGFAPSLGWLVAFRAVQALGAAMLSANSPAILTKSFPGTQRGQALGLQATMTYLGLTVGPTLGGWLTDQFSWRAIFYINIPVGLAALWLGLRHIPGDAYLNEARKVVERFDLVGAGAFMTGLIMLLLGLNRAHEVGWGSPVILGTLAASILILAGFIAYERRVENPMLDLSLFRNKLFSISVISAVLNYICLFSILFLMPFYLIQGRGFSPSQAGLLLSVQPVVMAIVAPLSGTLSDRIGVRLLTSLGMVLLAVGIFIQSRFGPDTQTLYMVAGLAITGMGTGIFISPNNSALMGSAPRQRQGIAAGILATSRNMGMVLGIGLAGAIFTTVMAQTGAGQPTATPSPVLFDAFRASFTTASGVALLGALISLVRSETEPVP
jgi:EmrB/QacA subfamily drug resistance transporter